jgi:hypothetical protein
LLGSLIAPKTAEFPEDTHATNAVKFGS